MRLAVLRTTVGPARDATRRSDFAATLTRTASGTVTVDYATEDQTATAGTDYTATSGTLTFVPRETENTVRAAILDDLDRRGSGDRPPEAVERVGARIADGKPAGRIAKTDPGQTAWLSRFGRAVAAGVVDALRGRIDRRAQVRSRRGEADLSLLRSFVLSTAGRQGATSYGADYGVVGAGGGYANASAASRTPHPSRQNGASRGRKRC